jgi:hypothetical protein
MTEKKLAANRRNHKLSRGPATPEGRARIRDAHLKHGFYSKSDEVALHALGEDPEEFRETLTGLKDPSTALAVVQERLGELLARDLVKVRRADRMQEGRVLQRAREEGAQREGRLHMQMMRLKMLSRRWEALAQSVARPHYVSTSADIEKMKQLHQEGVAREMSEVALALFWQLRKPGTLGPEDPGFEQEEEYKKAQRVVRQVKEIFGIGLSEAPPPRTAPGVAARTEGDGPPRGLGEGSLMPNSGMEESASSNPEAEEPEEGYADVTEEQWAAREPVRQLLENLLSRQIEIFDAKHREMLRQVVSGPSPQERAAEVAPTDPNELLLRRLEDSSFRKISRMTGLLIRLKRFERQGRDRDYPEVCHDVFEKKGI